MKIYTLILLPVLAMLAACNGDGTSTGDGSNLPVSEYENQDIAVVSTADYRMVCDQNVEILLVGCWGSELCGFTTTDSQGNSYWSRAYVVFRNDGVMTQHIRSYTNSDCIGQPFLSYDQPIEWEYLQGDTYTSSEGLQAVYLVFTWNIGQFSGSDITGYSMKDGNRLCFAGNDFNWDGQNGGLSSSINSTERVSTSINTQNCLTRF